MTKSRSVVHATFTLKRTYPASRRDVFDAFANVSKKSKWAYGAPEGAHKLDFRAGGHETVEMPGPGGGTFKYEGVYHEIVAGERIIYSYTFDMGRGPAGVTMTTVELADAEGGGTHLKFTEQGAYLDGFDGPKFWESGTTSLLDRLGQTLAD
ncbi:SRPBCC domain-containing protein [Roseibium sp.]|uniref:SRPBCC domain-containing protein n=1 Tax=Roseibium sp. TaxID=1936156 RepID=UPI003A98743C